MRTVVYIPILFGETAVLRWTAGGHLIFRREPACDRGKILLHQFLLGPTGVFSFRLSNGR